MDIFELSYMALSLDLRVEIWFDRLPRYPSDCRMCEKVQTWTLG